MTIYAYLPSNIIVLEDTAPADKLEILPPTAEAETVEQESLPEKIDTTNTTGMSTRSAAAGQALSGYTPSYVSNRNTGEAYMARRGWNGQETTESEANSISFHGSSSRWIYISIFILLVTLLLIAIIIIILLATGTIGGGKEEIYVDPSSTFNPIVNTLPPVIQPTVLPPVITNPPIVQSPPTLAPIITRQPQSNGNRVFDCSFRILRQANGAYDQKSSSNFQTAYQMVRTALITTIAQTPIQPQAPIIVLEDLRNSGNDLEVLFRLQFPPSTTLDTTGIRNILRSNVLQLQSRLGGSVQVDPSSIIVSQIN